MKRTLALALVAGALLLGGCARQHAAQPAGAPVATTKAPAASGVSGVSGVSGATSSSSSEDDVDSLLSDVDKQLSSDDQPSADQD
jgi:hypothetical protein